MQDDFKVNARLALNLGLRYDIMQPYRVYDRWSFMNPDLPNPAVGGYRARSSSPASATTAQCRTPIETYYGNSARASAPPTA